jgi:hypothetical protein
MTGRQAEIWTRDLPEMKQDRYLLGEVSVCLVHRQQASLPTLLEGFRKTFVLGVYTKSCHMY